MSSDYSGVSQFFSHPLVLLLIGALISGVLIPYFTNRAAKYQKGLEIKTDLIRRINESVMRLVISLNLLVNELVRGNAAIRLSEMERGDRERPLSGLEIEIQHELEKIEKQLKEVELDESKRKILDQKQKEVSKDLEDIKNAIDKIKKQNIESKNEFRQWQVSSAVIESQIGSYFPEFGKKTETKLTWSHFSKCVDTVYGYAKDGYADVLYSRPGDTKNWDELAHDLSEEKEVIVAQIQNSSVSGLSEHLFHRFIRKFTHLFHRFIRKFTHLFHRFIRKFTPRPKSIKPDVKTNHDSNP